MHQPLRLLTKLDIETSKIAISKIINSPDNLKLEQADMDRNGGKTGNGFVAGKDKLEDSLGGVGGWNGEEALGKKEKNRQRDENKDGDFEGKNGLNNNENNESNEGNSSGNRSNSNEENLKSW